MGCLTQYRIWGAKATETDFLQFWRLKSPRFRCQHGQFLLRALFPAYSWWPSYYVLTGSESSGFSSSFYKINSPNGLRPHLTISYNLYHFPTVSGPNTTTLKTKNSTYAFGGRCKLSAHNKRWTAINRNEDLWSMELNNSRILFLSLMNYVFITCDFGFSG